MQTVERPRFRQDLVAEPIDDDGGGSRFIDVADPDSGQLFRFYEVEYSLACAMDGERDVAGIVKWAEEELGLKPSATEVRSVISTLGELGYLESGKAAAAAASDHGAAAVAAAPVETSRPAPEPVRAEPPRAAEPPARPTPSPPARKANTPPAGTPAVKKPAPVAAEPVETNRWDQPTAMGDPDDYLQPGVVAGNKRANTPVPGVELGNAGNRAAGRDADLPSSGDMELGAPGARAAASDARGAARKGADMELGAPGAREKSESFSTDLAADMAVSPADVKAAVRASQVMKAADVPPELAAELDAPAAKQPAKQPEAKQPAKQPEAKQPAKQPEIAKRPETAKPIQMPTERPVLPKAPPPQGVSPLLLVLLALVVLGAGGFLLWKFVINKKKTETTQVTPTPTPTPAPPPAPAVETAKLAVEQMAAEEIKPSGAVQIATIVANDSTVKAGDTIAKLVGFKPSGDKVASLEKEIKIFQGQTTDAETARDAATTDAAKKPFETKLIGLVNIIRDREAKLVEARTELDKFLIKAPADGKVSTVAKANAKVTPTDIIATLQREPVMVATFKSVGEAAVDSKVLLAVKGSEQKLSCKVVATGGDGTKVACPKDAVPEGTEVSFAGPDTSAPTDAPTEGSAAPTEGSAAPTEGSAAPTEGSAAPTEGSAAPTEGSAAAPPTEEPKAEAPKAEPKAAPRPRPRPNRPRPAPTPPADKLFPPGSPSDKPAEPAPAPTPAPAPAPAGSGAL